MKSLKKVKSILPVSSRSFHAYEQYSLSRIAELERVISEQQQAILHLQDATHVSTEQLGSRIDTVIDAAKDNLICAINEQARIREEQDRLRHESIFRDKYPIDTSAETRRRIFQTYPVAEGPKRLSQLANAAVMNELHKRCVENNLPYWFAYGTLVATLSRNGSIPWDDDIDICMLRPDAEKLMSLLVDDPNWQVTLVYDQWVFCKQYRFCSRDSDIPCFIDISIYDWAASSDPESDAAFKKLRIDLMNELNGLKSQLPYWDSRKWLFAPNSGFVAQAGPIEISEQDNTVAAEEIKVIDEVFIRYQNKARALGILCDAEDAHAVGYAIDNIYDAPWRRTLWDISSIFPTRLHAYESYSFSIPNDAYGIADECYPGWPYLPNDILGHEHFSKDLLKNPRTQEKLRALIGTAPSKHS